MPLSLSQISLSTNNTVPAVVVKPGEPLERVPIALGLAGVRGTITVLGGAAAFDVPQYHAVRDLLTPLLRALGHVAYQHGLCVISGGTDAGVMRLIAQVRARHGRGFPLVGVAPLGRVTWPGRSDPPIGAALLHASYTAFMLVDAAQWGDESEALAGLAYDILGRKHSVEVIANGGAIARRDAELFAAAGGRLLVLAGTGRFADELAAAVKQQGSDDPSISRLASSQRVTVVDVHDGPERFEQTVLGLLELR